MNPSPRRVRLLRLATTWSVATAVVLMLVKSVAWVSTGSVSLLASLIDSMMDAVASIINLLAVRYALQPADEEHRFGHGKAESLAGLAQAAFISGSALLLLYEAVRRLMAPQPLEAVKLGLGVMVFSIIATVILLTVQRYVIRHTDSVAIKADSLHYWTDLLSNLSVIVALLLTMVGWLRADALFGLAIGAYILYGAVRIAQEAVQHLMDRELPEEQQQRIVQVALEHPDVTAVHDLRTRQSGHTKFIQLHIEMDGQMNLAQAHVVGDAVMLRLKEAVPGADVIIHQDPEDDSHPDMPGERIT
ncbi:MAG: cation diffusion facilitator family transporter [Chromatiales bacterium]|nr:cation diffusion facilitator family transporter [Chromatiales bacterium]